MEFEFLIVMYPPFKYKERRSPYKIKYFKNTLKLFVSVSSKCIKDFILKLLLCISK